MLEPSLAAAASFSPPPSFAAAASAPALGVGAKSLFQLPLSDPAMMQHGMVSDRTFSVCNTFNCAVRKFAGAPLHTLDLSSPKMVPVLQDALRVTLTEHSYPNQPFKPAAVIDTLARGGLKLPRAVMAPVLREFGIDLKPEALKPSAPGPDQTAFFVLGHLALRDDAARQKEELETQRGIERVRNLQRAQQRRPGMA